jgi:hypothetical protein
VTPTFGLPKKEVVRPLSPPSVGPVANQGQASSIKSLITSPASIISMARREVGGSQPRKLESKTKSVADPPPRLMAKHSDVPGPGHYLPEVSLEKMERS